MSVCAPCTQTQKVPTCTTDLGIGTIVNTNTAVYVYQKHIGTGREVRYDVTSDGLGFVEITLSDVMEDQFYEYRITLASATSIETEVNFTIGSTSVSCVTVPFVKVMQTDGDSQAYSSITLAL